MLQCNVLQEQDFDLLHLLATMRFPMRLGSLQAGGGGIYPNHDCNSADRQTLGDPERDGQPKDPYAQAVGEAGVPRSFKASGRHGIAFGVRPWCLAWGLQGRAHGLILKEVKLCHDR